MSFKGPYLTNHFPKKHLGQNFLIDHHIQRRIIEACQFKPTEVVLEIGPGKGTLTEQISPLVKKIIAVETDPNLIPGLNEKFSGTNVVLIHQDILNFDFKILPAQTKAVGNLPYNIATPIIERIVSNKGLFSTLYFMVQWEVGLRLCAQANKDDYSSLSCFIQYYAEPKILFKIKSTAFKPAPKVQSCFVEFKIRPNPVHPAIDEDLLFKVTRTAFQQRRKTLVNALSTLFDKNKVLQAMADLKIPEKARGENLELSDFVQLSNKLKQTM